MAFLELHCYSEALLHQVAMNVLLPQQHPWQKPLEGPRRTLYLLHGLGDDHTGWQRLTSLERYVEEQNIAVIMPSTMRGFWTDMADGGPRYWTFVSEELPALMESLLGIRPNRETTFAAGLSMGGYGALKLGFRCPERFRAVAALSAAPISRRMAKAQLKETDNEVIATMIRRVFGGELSPENDIFQLAEACREPRPDVYMAVGADDYLCPLNRELYRHIERQGYRVIWRETPGQAHTWKFWDLCLPKVIEWIMGFERTGARQA
ncbi:MAG: esterase family protein [Oscillospiraceae bacterium]|nr:esterase family protein [Oscillospiraceae bacterium]